MRVGAAAKIEAALGLLEEADHSHAEERALLEPLYRARGWKGTAGALSAMRGNGSIPSKAELGQAMARRREALTRIADKLDGQAREVDDERSL